MATSRPIAATSPPQLASAKAAVGPPAPAQRSVKCIATTAELKAFLAANGNRLCVNRPQVVGIDFALVDTCRKHSGRPCIAAVAIASNMTSEPALVLLLADLDTAVLATAFKVLCADNTTTKAMFAVQRAAIAWRVHFNEHLLNEPSAMKRCVDLQLLLEHAMDSKRRNASATQLAQVAGVYGWLNTSSSFNQQHPQLGSCGWNEVTSKLQQRLVQNAQLLAIIYVGLRSTKQPIGAKNAQTISANEWKQRLGKVTKLTADRCVQAVTSAGRPQATKTINSQPNAAVSTSTSRSDTATQVQQVVPPFAVAQRNATLISTTTQLETFLGSNGGRLVLGNPQVVGIDFMLVDHCREHDIDGDTTSPLCIAGIAIASAKSTQPALVLSPQSIDPELLATAFRGLWADANVTKAMFALRRPAVAWHSRLKSHLVDESSPTPGAAIEDLQSLLEQATSAGGHVLPESSTIHKCVDLQLLMEHVVDSKRRDATALQLATVAKIDAAANQLALSNFSYKSVTAATGPSHRHASCSREDVKTVDLQRLVQNAQLFATIYTSLRTLPLPLESDEPSVVNAAEWKQKLVEVTRMTADRCVNAVANQGSPSIWFDKRADYQPRSLECLVSSRVCVDTDGEDEDDDYTNESTANGDDVLPLHRLELQCDIDPLLAVLPLKYRAAVMRIDGFRDRLVDVCLDVGRAPYVYIGKRQRVPLEVQDDWGSGPGSTAAGVVSKADVEEILALLGGEERIGSDNRAGIDAQLHRVSVMRSKTREVYGVTLRVGRALLHAASALSDLLLSRQHRDKSVLLLGHPGSGKTTLIRDVARCVAETQENVCIIDTSNEIGGDGLVPHACVGWARRMMVPSLEMQAAVMIECVQNHTVETMVVDEIGRKPEVLAASTVRQRGPRLVASAHGDFRSLLTNPELKGLVGGTQQVTVGDAAAKVDGIRGKLRTERAGNPVFDVIVELDRQSQGVCHVIWDVAKAVDSVLAGEPVVGVETRRWSNSTRGVQVLS